jgi:hypothetical protein
VWTEHGQTTPGIPPFFLVMGTGPPVAVFLFRGRNARLFRFLSVEARTPTPGGPWLPERCPRKGGVAYRAARDALTAPARDSHRRAVREAEMDLDD